jgi:ketosteroid isomerase-like protein
MSQSVAAMLSINDTATLRATTDTFGRILIDKDLDAFTSLYTPEAVVLPPHQPAVQGLAQIKAFLQAFPKVTRCNLEILEIDGRDDLAYVRGSYSMTIEPEGAPGPIEDVGKFLDIRKRQSDGSWKIAVDTFNSDKP